MWTLTLRAPRVAAGGGRRRDPRAGLPAAQGGRRDRDLRPGHPDPCGRARRAEQARPQLSGARAHAHAPQAARRSHVCDRPRRMRP
eukprot:1793563-Rhodomonas_salina.2